jgi:hypothetical protein
MGVIRSGEIRLRDLLASLNTSSPEEIRQAVVDSVDKFLGAAAPQDGTGGANVSLFQFRWFNGIWECCDDAKVQRGTGSKVGLRRLELAILRSERAAK